MLGRRLLHMSRNAKAPENSLRFIRESPVVHTKTWLEALQTRQKLLDALPPDQKRGVVFSHNDVKTREVSPRRTGDSFSAVVFPFKDDPWFLDGYVNSFGRLRMGQLFMDLDRLSGIIANKHCAPAEPVIVTASVDRILLLKRIDDLQERNLVLWGYVSWTGRSSMEITIHAASTSESFTEPPTLEECRTYDSWLVANFTFVARDPVTQKAFPINNLTPITRQELSEFVIAEKYNQKKKGIAKKQALTISPPSEEESRTIHNLWIKGRDMTKEEGRKITMKDTTIHSTGIMQPQYRNRHSYMIFGGYMMRQTFELAYACAAAFTHLQPRFVSLDTVTFKNPVPVGSVLHLKAFVAYTQPGTRSRENLDNESTVDLHKGTLVQIRVQSTVRDLDKENDLDAGTFIYSFFVEGDSGYIMIPESYEEMVTYLDGRRLAKQIEEYLDEIVTAV
ncbi:hypothetical protein DASB73_014350 [Starmerella bacillaris]|uniref:HotDog ACOT-type domain-containing protein n=1 Tax=Starmerella bacillaris TaxID=1247836 RepID=A0AAV5RGZ1_STABA|nr:hypothetical protein DASB73_014350 [Starmerella bacillaris]